MSTDFSAYTFSATGGTTARTLPDRLGEIKNVLDFGADPTNSVDSSAAIQAAVDAVMSAGGGTVYFPLGFYKLNSSITFNDDNDFGILFRGEPGTIIDSGAAGYAFDRHLGSPNNTSGPRGFVNLQIQNGTGSGAIRLGSTNGGFVRDCVLSGHNSFTSEDSAGVSSQNISFENCKFGGDAVSGGMGLIMGGSGTLFDCDFLGNDIAVVAYGKGLAMAGNRIENNNTAYQFGKDSAGTNQGMSAFSVHGSTEGCLTFMHMAGTCVGGFIGPIGFQGHSTSGPGQDTPTHYGLVIDADCAQACVFVVQIGSYVDTAGISIANATSRTNNVFLSSGSGVIGGGTDWVLPTNAYTAIFLQCNINPVWTYSQLPSGGNVIEGDEFNISDSNTATWGATAGGSGSNHVLVRWNGSNWTVVGK